MSDREELGSALLGAVWILSVLAIIVIFGVETAHSTGRLVLSILGLFYVVGSVICWLLKLGKG